MATRDYAVVSFQRDSAISVYPHAAALVQTHTAPFSCAHASPHLARLRISLASLLLDCVSLNRCAAAEPVLLSLSRAAVLTSHVHGAFTSSRTKALFYFSRIGAPLLRVAHVFLMRRRISFAQRHLSRAHACISAPALPARWRISSNHHSMIVEHDTFLEYLATELAAHVLLPHRASSRLSRALARISSCAQAPVAAVMFSHHRRFVMDLACFCTSPFTGSCAYGRVVYLHHRRLSRSHRISSRLVAALTCTSTYLFMRSCACGRRDVSGLGPASLLARAFGSLSFALPGLLRVSFFRPSVALVYGSGHARVPFPPTRLSRWLFCSSGTAASAGTADPPQTPHTVHLASKLRPAGAQNFILLSIFSLSLLLHPSVDLSDALDNTLHYAERDSHEIAIV
ncbi:hypothetical protein B0H13DRAFT_2301676 [Mycena leptocephala]|nr:hypothetical protein B0H13DRAFT_2301676 [Mycena leptocephala]